MQLTKSRESSVLPGYQSPYARVCCNGSYIKTGRTAEFLGMLLRHGNRQKEHNDFN